MKFSNRDFFSKCDQIRGFRRIWSRLLKTFLMENFIFCTVLWCELHQITRQSLTAITYIRSDFSKTLVRGNHRRCSVKTGFQACNFIKTGLQHRCLPVKFGKFSRTPILRNIRERLLRFGAHQPKLL